MDKNDKNKMRHSLLIEGVPNGLASVTEVLQYGARKYEDHGWKKIENNIPRYKEALYRHLMNLDGGLFSKDKESGLLHLAHLACNALILLELVKNDEGL